MKLPGRDLPWKQFLGDVAHEWSNDALTDVAGSVTFFAILSLFPFMIFLVSLTSLFVDPKDTEALVASMRHTAPAAVTDIIGRQLTAITSQKSPGIVTISALTAIWSASSGLASLTGALNTCYGVKEGRPFWKVRGLAILMTLLAAVISLLAAFAAVALPPILAHLGGPMSEVVGWLRVPAAAALMMFLWALVYYLLPDTQQSFKFITPGSVTGVLLWLIVSHIFSLYVSHFGTYDVVYGALGGVVVMLLWMWISVLALLLGAEINAIIEQRSPEGKRTGAKSLRDVGEDVPKHLKPRPGRFQRPQPT